jgi:minor extracellular serine protease Vpr
MRNLLARFPGNPVPPRRPVRRALRTAAYVFALASVAVPRTGGAAALSGAIRRSLAVGGALADRFLTRRPGAEPLVNLLLGGRPSPEALRALGIEVNTVTAAGMTARCPLSRLPLLESTPGIDAVVLAPRCHYLLDRSAADADVASVRASVPPGFAGQTGAGVLIGLVDSGIDLVHGDFHEPDSSTRLVSVWDQTVEGTHPQGFTYGSVWTPAQINAGTATETDDDGHGTHVLGIAAGDGSTTGHGQPPFVYVGMAPEADLCAVKTDLTGSGIVDAIHYIFQVAAARNEPAVVNLSLGTQEGPHDGSLLLDTMIDQLTGPGRIVVAAAGNDGVSGIHARLTLTSGTSQPMTFTVPAYTPAPGTENDYVIVSAWYGGSDRMAVTLTSPHGTVLGPVAPGDSLTAQSTPDGYIDLYNGVGTEPDGDNQVWFQIYDAAATSPPASGTWTLQFTALSVTGSGQVDSYIETSVLGNGTYAASFAKGLVFGGVVTAPADADSVIAVGAHVTKVCWDALDGEVHCVTPAPPLGSIANFSSQGPRRDGVLKPDLTAPGVVVVSARSHSAYFVNAEVAPDGTHAVEEGTSMSTPHVTGAAALLLAHRADASAGPSWIRSRLTATARSDSYTGAVPNPSWGAGKLDIAAALGPALDVSVLHPTGAHVAPPGQPDSVKVRVAGGPADSVVVTLSRDGGVTYGQRLGATGPVADGQTAVLPFTPDASWSTFRARLRCVAYNATMGDVAAYSDSLFLIQNDLGTLFRAITPNPFRASTTIRFDLPAPGRVSVRIYSARGALVQTLADRVFSAGWQAVDWDGTDSRGLRAGSGIYFCDFRDGDVHEVRKIAFLR